MQLHNIALEQLQALRRQTGDRVFFSAYLLVGLGEFAVRHSESMMEVMTLVRLHAASSQDIQDEVLKVSDKMQDILQASSQAEAALKAMTEDSGTES